MIWLTSDWHFGHDREFIWGPRGFKSVWEMNEVILENHNVFVSADDDVYVLGDLMLGDSSIGMSYLAQMNGRIHIVCGNHDTEARKALYREAPNVVEIADAITLKYHGYHFFMCHYPTLTGNLERESLKQVTINLFGHTHQKNDFFQDVPFMFHCGIDSHFNCPVAIDRAIEDMEAKVQECKSMLDVDLYKVKI